MVSRNKMTDIFVSYASEDLERTAALIRGFRSRGWSVWSDQSIQAGRSWDRAIEAALDDCRCVVVLWSKASTSSDWVRSEASHGNKRRVLVPILIDDVADDIPLEFSRIQAASLVGWDGDQAAPEFREAAEAVAAVLEPKERAPVPPPPSPKATTSLRNPGARVLAAAGCVLLGLVLALGWFSERPQIVVQQFESGEGVDDSTASYITTAIYTALHHTDAFNVYNQAMNDFKSDRAHLLELVEELQIERNVFGELSKTRSGIKLDIYIFSPDGLDLVTPMTVFSAPDESTPLAVQAATAVMGALRLEMTDRVSNALQRIAATSEQEEQAAETYNEWGEMFGAATPPAPQTSGLFHVLSPAEAHAADEEPAIEAVLLRYRDALREKDEGQLDALFVDVKPEMREAHQRYFASTDGLAVQFSDFDILVDGDEALATFTRSDSFEDARTGRSVQLEMRISSLLVKSDARWQIRGLKQP